MVKILTVAVIFFSVISDFFLVFAAREKYRVCVVNGKGSYKKSLRYCPKLDHLDSPVECVVGLDRLDCLRKIHKNKADFSVFTAEDLVAATNSQIEILLTNELRYETDNPFEYEVVAVMSNHAHIKSKHDLRNKKFCHPGYGYEADWTRILSNYFENSVIPRQCHPELTITENKIKASSEFFDGACKAGPWVNNEDLDDQLKQKYRNLCRLCGNQWKCSQQDNYWGRKGSLLCLTDGSGDISWARLDDVKQHFGLTPGGAVDSSDYYSYLCPDDTTRPVNSSRPCVWTVKPWSVIGSRRPIAQDIQTLVSNLTRYNDNSWSTNLLSILEDSYVTFVPLDPVESIESYFMRAEGFLQANSFSSCHLPRTIRLCTTSNLEYAKCAWLRESAAVYGIEPDVECFKADNTTHCMAAVNQNVVDVVMVDADLVPTGLRDYNLSTLFYETVYDDAKYITVPVTRKGDKKLDRINSLEDLRGVKACFPKYDGVAWHSTIRSLENLNLIKKCASDKEIMDFFGKSCIPGITNETLHTLCDFQGDKAALNCLLSGLGDVAFVDRNVLDKHKYSSRLRVICPTPSQPECHLSWASPGQAMIRSNSTPLWIKDTLDVFLQIDSLFGKNFKDLTSPFSMFGPYDGKNDVLFHDVTVKLRDVPTLKNTDRMPFNFEDIWKSESICSSGIIARFNIILVLWTFVISVSFFYMK